MCVYLAKFYQVEVDHQVEVIVEQELVKEQQQDKVVTQLQQLEEMERHQPNQLVVALLLVLVAEMV